MCRFIECVILKRVEIFMGILFCFVLFGFGHGGLYLLVRLGVSITRFGAWVGLVLLRNGWRFYVFQRFV